jgi:hypothetical protein
MSDYLQILKSWRRNDCNMRRHVRHLAATITPALVSGSHKMANGRGHASCNDMRGRGVRVVQHNTYLREHQGRHTSVLTSKPSTWLPYVSTTHASLQCKECPVKQQGKRAALVKVSAASRSDMHTLAARCHVVRRRQSARIPPHFKASLHSHSLFKHHKSLTRESIGS